MVDHMVTRITSMCQRNKKIVSTNVTQSNKKENEYNGRSAATNGGKEMVQVFQWSGIVIEMEPWHNAVAVVIAVIRDMVGYG